MPARNTDGTIRNARAPKKLTDNTVRARWVEAEVLRLKRFGLSFVAVAEQITAIGRGEATAMTAIPPGLTFKPNYHLGPTACHKAYHRAVNREPSLEVEEMRRLDNDRHQDYLVSLQPAIRKGDKGAIAEARKIHMHLAQINGYAAPQKVALTDKDGSDIISIDAINRLLQAEDEK